MAELHTATALSSGELADDLEIPARKAAATGLKKLTLGQIKEACKATGLLTLMGTTDCSANPNYPASSLKGDTYYVTVAGKIGGASGKSVDVGDAYICLADNAGGDEATVGTSWFVLEHNLVSALTGALASTTEVLTGTDNTKIATPDAIAALWEKGADIASAGTISIGEGGFFHVTGATTITDIDFGTDHTGRGAWLEFDGILTLTHSSTLILPTSANIATAAGDCGYFVSEGSDAIRCLVYQRASGSALGASGSYIGQGTHTIPILAGAMQARTTNGPASGSAESTTNKVMQRTLDFDASTAEYAQVVIPMPKSWDEGTVTCQFIWRATNTGNVVWGCQAVALSDDDVYDAAFGTAQTVTDGVTATTDLMESAFTSAITIAGTPAAEDLVCFQFYRDAASGSDTCAVDALLIGVRIKYTVNAGDDA